MGRWFSKQTDELGWSVRSRARMVAEQLQPRGVSDPRVLAAMMRVPRERFVPRDLRDWAYDDEALAIGRGQTISQPYMVAIMSQLLALRGGERVLEIGTGSGYQSAILAELVARQGQPGQSETGPPGPAAPGWVHTIERLAELSESARSTLESLGYQNISFHVGDGSRGWPMAAPFDAILLTAGAPQVPQPLIDQLADGGRFVGPVGPAEVQTLVRWTRQGQPGQPGGQIVKEHLFECRFVRLIGAAGWAEEK
jgi:protein-L-isoaspartate(D-aspartate) O-methyltransferase